MNGDAKEIYERIIKLETKMSERWNNHERRSQDLLKSIDRQFQGMRDLISEKFTALPCGERIKEVNGRFKLVWTFITIIIVALIGVSIRSLWG